jgi:hypothetical protein
MDSSQEPRSSILPARRRAPAPYSRGTSSPGLLSIYDLGWDDPAAHVRYHFLHLADLVVLSQKADKMMHFHILDYALQYYFILWFLLAGLAFTVITTYGISYVRWPLMLPLTDIIYYEGPGFRSARNGMGLDGFGRFVSSKLSQGAGVGAKLMAGSRARALSRSEEIEMGKLKRVD